jgi:UDP-hydrolysing UDP-N-acetyl-D-glucosamine 2-epimerase
VDKRKVLYVTGTRADYGLMRSTLRAIEEHPGLLLEVAATGMHLMPEFGLTIEEVRGDGFTVRELDATYEEDSRESMSAFVGKCVGLLSEAVAGLRPDVLLLLGDRGEMLAGAVVGAYQAVPVAHVHGGDVSSTVDDFARHAITKLAHVHLPATRKSAERIRRMGEEPWRIHVVGAPGLDEAVADELTPREVVLERFSLDPGKPILLVVQHPVTLEVDQAARQMRETLEAALSGENQVVLVYPNSDAGGRGMIEAIREHGADPRLRAFESIPRGDYLGLMRYADAMVGNSSSALIEAPAFGLPVVNVGSRQEGRERAENVIDVGYGAEEIASGIARALSDDEFKARARSSENPYGHGRTGPRIADILNELVIDGRLLDKRLVFDG